MSSLSKTNVSVFQSAQNLGDSLRQSGTLEDHACIIARNFAEATALSCGRNVPGDFFYKVERVILVCAGYGYLVDPNLFVKPKGE